MKVTAEHYKVITEHFRKFTTIQVIDHAEFIRTEGKAKDESKRLRWDIMHYSGLTPFLCDTLYKYCDDTHVDTALKQAMKEVFNIK